MVFLVYFNWDNSSEVSREQVERLLEQCGGMVSYKEETNHNVLEPESLKYELIVIPPAFDPKRLEADFNKACGGYGFLTIWPLTHVQAQAQA
jgi:hypothetical protein